MATLALSASSSSAKVFLTVDEALSLAFPNARVERDTVYLTDRQLERARKLAEVEIETAVVYPYRAYKDDELVGTAYFDTHRVRTLPETVMVVVGPNGSVERVELLSFREPEEYIPPGHWYKQLLNQKLDEELNLKRAIPSVMGATLTARATVEAVRRMLAIHRVMRTEEQSE